MASVQEDPYGCKSELVSEEVKHKRRLMLKEIIKGEKKRTVKEKVKRVDELSKILHTSKVPSSTVRYTTTKKTSVKTHNPYKDMDTEKILTKGYVRPTLRWRLCSDIRDRIAVPQEEVVGETLDTEFFSITKGRPIKEKFQKNKYIEKLRKETINTIKNGIISDKIKAKEEKEKLKVLAIKKQQDEINEVSAALSRFLSEEQKKCEELENELKEVEKMNAEKEAKLEKEQEKMGNTKLKIFHENEKLEKIKKCREFLMELAPEEWKSNYEQERMERKNAEKPVVEKLKEAFEKFKVCCGGEDTSLEEIIENFLDEYSNAGPTKLPFDDPNEVFRLFREMELKCIRALNRNTQIHEAVNRAKGVYQETKDYYERQKDTLNEILNDLQKSIAEEEKLLNEREALIKDLRNIPVKDLVSSDEVLTQQAMIKNVYDEVIERPKKNLNSFEMAQEIGELYYDLRRRLDKFSPEERLFLEKSARKKLEAQMIEAEKSHRRKTQVENMLKGLERAGQKPFVKSGRPLSFRFPPAKGTLVKGSHMKKEDKVRRCVEEDLKAKLPLVWHMNHPSPGPYRPQSPSPDALEGYESFYPDLTLEEPGPEDELLSESDEDIKKEGFVEKKRNTS